MKLLLLLTLLIGFALALETAVLEERQGRGSGKRQRKKTYRPKKSTGVTTARAPNKPRNAPSDYKTGTGRASSKRNKSALKKLPADYIDAGMRRRWESWQTLRRLRRQAANANDFYECYNTNSALKVSDCQTVIDQVLESNDELIVTANSCLVFSFRTCQGFFCSLCQTLGTSTDFIGNQLDTIDALCLGGGQVGSIVGQDPPQWDAGFTYINDGLPTYDVC
ncbi:hypothetical protein V8F33_000692 [Rhypophila sp. PSN 637]